MMDRSKPRLIDANKLIEQGYILERHGESNKLLCRKSIADVPTAYDVEVVVKDIQDIGTRFCVSAHCNDECECCDHGSIMKSIIEIVRTGGVK